jgi:hypothetical protein
MHSLRRFERREIRLGSGASASASNKTFPLD